MKIAKRDLYQKELRRAIVQLKPFAPEKIILYGSMVRRSPSKESDLDLLLVKSTKKPFLKRNIEAASYLDLAVPYDIFVVTPQEFQKGILENSPFFYEIIKTGRTVYERPS